MTSIQLTTGVLDLATGVLARPSGEPLRLTEQEQGLLGYLVARPNQDVDREVLLREVLGYRDGVVSRAVDDAIKRLRSKVERLPARPFHVVSVRGVGYRFVPLEQGGGHGLLRLGPHVVDLERLLVRTGAVEQSLSGIEGRILEILAQHDGRPVSSDTLLREIWHIRDPSKHKVVDKAVYRLRLKLESDPRHPAVLRTVRGRGLALESQGFSPRASLRPGRSEPPRAELHGREALVRRVGTLLRPRGALVTLLGPGGIGKTALARAIAAEREGASVLVDLHGVRHDADLVRAVAAALGVDSDRWDRIRGSLRQDPDLLLLLDDADTSLDAVRRALAELPETRVLVTSRAPLGLLRERGVTVGPLDPLDAAALVRDRAAEHGIGVDADDPRLGHLVAELQGVPLALELAAARLRLLGLDGVLARVERPLELLRSDQGGRHGTMRVAVELSTELLSEGERRLLTACAAFPGSFSFDAAEVVCAPELDGPVVEGLGRLLDHALLWSGGQGRMRLGLAVADVVSTWPGADGVIARARTRHLEWCAGLWSPRPDRPAPAPQEIVHLRQELDGALAALRWGLEGGAREPAARCARWAAFVLLYSGRASEAEDLLRTLGDLGDLPTPLAIDVLGVAVQIFLTTLDLRESATRLASLAALAPPESPEGCRALANQYVLSARGSAEDRRRLGARLDASLASVEGLGRVRLLRARAWVRARGGESDGAWADLQEALTVALRGGFTWECVYIYKHLAIQAEREGRLDEAASLLENRWRHLAPAVLPEEDGDGVVVLTRIRENQGRLAEAAQLLEEQLLRARTQGHRGNITQLLGSLANLRATMGELEGALAAYAEALGHAVELDSRELVASLTLNMGEVRAWLDEPEAALPLVRRARGVFLENGETVYAAFAHTLEARVRARQGEPEAAEALYRDAIAALLPLGRPPGLAEARLGLAEVLAKRGEPDAGRLADEALELGRAGSKAADLAALVVQRGEVARLEGDVALARRCAADGAELARRAGLGPRSGAGQALARLRAALDEAGPPVG